MSGSQPHLDEDLIRYLAEEAPCHDIHEGQCVCITNSRRFRDELPEEEITQADIDFATRKLKEFVATVDANRSR